MGDGILGLVMLGGFGLLTHVDYNDVIRMVMITSRFSLQEDQADAGG